MTNGAPPPPPTLTDAASSDAYIDALFGAVDFEPQHYIALRPMLENGQGGRSTVAIYPAALAGGLEAVKLRVRHYVQMCEREKLSAFIIPAVCQPHPNDEPGKVGARTENIAIILAIAADFDRGRPAAALRHAESVLGPATMVVESGGVTEEHAPKLHAYWTLKEPAVDPAEQRKVMEVQSHLARVVGADTAFALAAGSSGADLGRAHQPIRIAGSVHQKRDARPVRLTKVAAPAHDASEMLDAIAQARPMEGLPPAPVRIPGSVQSGQFTFGPGAISSLGDPARLLNGPVAPGGADGVTRFDSFNQAAGLLIATARQNSVSYQDSLIVALGFQANLGEGWNPPRIAREFKALWDHDVKEKGAMPVPAAEKAAKQQELAGEETAEHFGADMWGDWETEPRQFIVKGMLMMGAPHMLAAEGGAGKTYGLLDLVAKVADPQPGDTWLGMPIIAAHCGPVWMFTTEDDVKELRRRFKDLGHKERVQRAAKAGRLVVIPTINTRRGSFTLVARERDGTSRHSDAWENWLRQMESGEVPALVIVDTTNGVMHGDENNATEVGEFIRAAMQVCGRFGAAFLATHHVRKQGDDPIRTEDDMLNAIRGSGALVAGMRGVIGIWHDADYQEVLPMIGLEPHQKQLYQMALVKKNNNEFLNERRHLVRHQAAGFLVDATKEVRAALAREDAAGNGELVAYVRQLVECAEDQRRPLAVASVIGKRKLYLPKPYSDLSKGEIEGAVTALLQSGEHLELVAPPKLKGAIVRRSGRFAAGLDTEPNGGGFERPQWGALTLDPVTTRLVPRA